MTTNSINTSDLTPGEKLFKRIREEIVESPFRDFSTSIVGSKIFETNNLILGNNWGGDEKQESQTDYPKGNDIIKVLEEKKEWSPTYNGYFNFFKDLFDDDRKAKKYIDCAIFTNACFIRTPNQGKEYQELINEGFLFTKDRLKSIIDTGNVKNIICFGKLAFEAIKKIYTIDKIEMKKYGHSRFNYAHFPVRDKEKELNIFKLPHASKYHSLWKWDDIKNEDIVKELKSKIEW